MASKTKLMRQQEETIKSAIVRGHKSGLCDKNGNTYLDSENNLRPIDFGRPATKIYTSIPIGREKLNVWPRDKDGNLIQ